METLQSWVNIPDSSDFTIYNLPVGIFSTGLQKDPRVGVAIGNEILDLARCSDIGLLAELANKEIFYNRYLNDYIGLGKKVTSKIRQNIQNWLTDDTSKFREYDDIMVPQSEAIMHLPLQIGDYTDFYSSIEHATNVGKMFRDPENALLPNWRHIPVGYHGRASSIIESGIAIHRPQGQTKPADAPPIYGPTKRLDFELEMAFVIGKASAIGERITTKEAENHIFGLVLFNDWSARDIQKWEYVPLGPFLSKNFASSISPWIVPLEALAPFKVPGPAQDPAVLPYLQYQGDQNYDIDLTVSICPDEGQETIISRSNFKYMYWNMAQQLAHHTVNGCNVKVGDLMASGTISGQDEHSYGSMLEIAWSGQKPISLTDGTQRSFVEDFDTVTMKGSAEKNGVKVGFGSVSTKVLPAR